MIIIRCEGQVDYKIVYEVNKLAFEQEEEARLVEKIRQLPNYIPELSLVAVENKKIIGHILFSIVNIKNDKGAVVVGHPNYYPRFGFTPAKETGLKLPFDAPDEAFLVVELIPGALNTISGTIEYPPAFDGIA